MNARRVNTAAGVILAAQKTRETAAGIAAALESACLLQSPETADEVLALRARVAELEAGSPWERAVAGLNALVDADVAFWIEPDGHISGPFSDEHIEWDQKASRWVLTHDDEDDAHPPLPAAPRDLRPGADAARRMIRDRQTTAEDPHDSPLHHTYATGRDLPSMTADEWNARYPIGTPIVAYPVTRDDEGLTTVTRSRAWTLGHGSPVVSVEGYGGGICLTHVDPLPGAAS